MLQPALAVLPLSCSHSVAIKARNPHVGFVSYPPLLHPHAVLLQSEPICIDLLSDEDGGGSVSPPDSDPAAAAAAAGGPAAAAGRRRPPRLTRVNQYMSTSERFQVGDEVQGFQFAGSSKLVGPPTHPPIHHSAALPALRPARSSATAQCPVCDRC